VPVESTVAAQAETALDAYRQERLVLYDTGPTRQWGCRKGNGDLMSLVEFAEALGDDDTEHSQGGVADPQRSLVDAEFPWAGPEMKPLERR